MFLFLVFIHSQMSTDLDQRFPLPPPLKTRERKPRGKPTNVGDAYEEDLGPLNTIRDGIWTALNARGINPPHLDLQSQISDIAYRKSLPPAPKAPPRQRKVLERIGVGEDDSKEGLFQIIQGLKRDIRLIKDAQSKAGAEDWIQRNGLENQLYVDDRDIDGDSIPDIIVRRRDTRKPYIVKGYTTEQSSYPLKHEYYDMYPTAADRVGNSYRTFLEDDIVDSIDDGGYSRTYTNDILDKAKKSRAAGYKVSLASKPMTNNQAFKYHFMKPLMKAFKDACWDLEYDLHLDPLLARNIEAWTRENVITVPVMIRVYGNEIFQVDKADWRKLSQRKEIKDGCKLMIQYLSANKAQNDIINALVETIVNIIATHKGLPEGANPDQIKIQMKGKLVKMKEWLEPKLKPIQFGGAAE
jgi:hypothetical protein